MFSSIVLSELHRTSKIRPVREVCCVLSIENDERVKKWRFMLLFHKLIMKCLQQKMYMLQTGTFTKDENHAPLDVRLFDAMLGI